MGTSELQTRTCRACGRSFQYPVVRSPATRFHCESCVRLDEATRETFEHFQKQLSRMAGEIERLRGRDAGGQPPGEQRGATDGK